MCRFYKGAVISLTYNAGVENRPYLCYVAMILSINGVLSTICSLTPTTNFLHFCLVDGKKSKKLFVTMVIRNVTLNDDSTYGALGRYECHAFQLVTLWREDMDLVSLSLEVSHLRG